LDTTPTNHLITFSIRIIDDSGYEEYFSESIIVIGKSSYEIFDFDVIEYEGDGDTFVDAGEKWEASITIKNIGEAIGRTVNVNQTDTYYITKYWRFTISNNNIPNNYKISFTITITDNSGYKKDFITEIIVVEGGIIESIDGNIDGNIVGFLILSIFSVMAIIGFIYANSHYDWNIGVKIKNIKNRKKEKQELKGNKFENLMRKSKDLVDKGEQYYSKESFLTAIDKWKNAINYYKMALKKAPTFIDKSQIKNNIKILEENICYAYIQEGKKNNKEAKKVYKEKEIQNAEKKWNLAMNSFKIAIDLIKSKNLKINYEQIEFVLKSIKLNLKQLEIEKLCMEADKKLEKARSLKNKDLKEAILLVQNSFLQYSEAKSQAEKSPEFPELVRKIQVKMENIRNFQSKLQNKMDELIGITPLTTKVIINDIEDNDYNKVETIIEVEKREKVLSIIREYEFIGGQIRFKIGLINNTESPLTNFQISFDIPDALKWIMHEPNYERKGDNILIPKIGINEKKAVSLYLEPINCMKSPINAIISFFDAKDRPQAIPMKPKIITISCPIFFTEKEANLARVKHLQRILNHHDKKIYPILNSKKISQIFSVVISTFSKHHIQLVFKEFSEKDKFGEAWFYGITKIKKNRYVMYVVLDGENKTLELEVFGDDEEQITAFLAEVGNQIREQLIKYNIITPKERFYDIRISVLQNECPFCGAPLSADLVKEYNNGKSIKCDYCSLLISNLK